MMNQFATLHRVDNRARHLLLINGLFLVVSLFVGYRIYRGAMGYTVGETLMHYGFGFYRRALFGNLFMPVRNKEVLTVLLALTYGFSLTSPLFILTFIGRSRDQLLTWFSMILVILSPFGILFYLKDISAIRKELLFLPLFYFLIRSVARPGMSAPVLVAICIGLGMLIHESFFFLFMPFLLCYMWLNDLLTTRWAMGLAGMGAALLALVALLPGNSAQITDRFIQEYTELGFPRESFRYFRFYQSMTTRENIDLSLRHFVNVSPLSVLALYLVQFALLYVLFRLPGFTIRFKKPKALLVSLRIVLLMAIGLCVIGMDYGRWLAMVFITSLILVVSQVSSVTYYPIRQSPLLYIGLFLAALAWGLVVRAPYYTPTNTFDLEDWVSVTDVLR